MTPPMNEENLRIIFGLKVKSYRTRLGLSLQELSRKSGIAVSYLSEIESGKKYPKPEKSIRLAEALEVDYDTLVSARVSRNLDPFAALINSELIRQFPFHLFGISASDILGLFKNNPENAHAFLQTFLQISRAYDMSLENFLFAALRTYIRQHANFFPELEQLAEQYAEQLGINQKHLDFNGLKKILEEKYDYRVDESELTRHHELRNMRSVLKRKGQLAVNGRLLPSQKAFVLAREIGFLELGFDVRPRTSSWIKVESFDQLVNNYKASYFGGALLLPKDRLADDFRKVMGQSNWNQKVLSDLLEKYRATPEMLLYRLTQLLPGVFGLSNIFYSRFVNGADSTSIILTKELNMTESLVSYGVGINEHYCRRLLPLRLLKRLHQENKGVSVGVQKIEFVKNGELFLLLSMARPLSLSEKRGSAIALGIQIDHDSRKYFEFVDDPEIPFERVGESCERCPLTDCCERVAEARLVSRQKSIEQREAALQEFIDGE